MSSFNRLLKPSEIAVLARFDLIQVSIDTVDAAVLRSVRKSVDVKTIVFNCMAIRAEALRLNLPIPRFSWLGVLTNAVVMDAPRLVATAAACGVSEISYNDMVKFEAAPTDICGVMDMPDDAFLPAIAALQEARELAQRLGLKFHFNVDHAVEQRVCQILGPDILAERFKCLPSLDWISGQGRIFVFGAGVAGRMMMRALGRRGESVAGVIDNFASGVCENRQILSFNDYLNQRSSDDIILICSRSQDQIVELLRLNGLDNYLKSYGLFANDFQHEAPSAGVSALRQGIQGAFEMSESTTKSIRAGATRNCISPWNEAVIDPKGEVYACCHRGEVMGVISKNTIFDQILVNEAYQTLRRSLVTGEGLDAVCRACAITPPCDTDILIDRLAGLFNE